MPYRRLPNTDAARVKAMKAALYMSMKVSPYNLAFSHLNLQKLKTFFPLFEQAIIHQRQAYSSQIQKSKTFNELTKKARIYLSHFIQVMNFMIIRGELPETDRKYYGMSAYDKSLPSLISDTDLIEIGEQIVNGDQERQRNGGKLITNPTAAVVRVHYEKFTNAYYLQKNLQKINNQAIQKVAELRGKADEIILLIWNEIENKYSELEDNEKREKCAEYGIAYVYRPNERVNGQKKSLSEERADRFRLTSVKTDPAQESDVQQIPLFSVN